MGNDKSPFIITNKISSYMASISAKWKPVFECLPIESQNEKFQGEYDEAIARRHAAGESAVFSIIF